MDTFPCCLTRLQVLTPSADFSTSHPSVPTFPVRDPQAPSSSRFHSNCQQWRSGRGSYPQFNSRLVLFLWMRSTSSINAKFTTTQGSHCCLTSIGRERPVSDITKYVRCLLWVYWRSRGLLLYPRNPWFRISGLKSYRFWKGGHFRSRQRVVELQ